MRILSDTIIGNLDRNLLAGHQCEIYEPPTPRDHGYVVIYLHGVHLNSLRDKVEFSRQFDRHGLRVLCPRTGPSWWTDKDLPRFRLDDHGRTVCRRSMSELDRSALDGRNSALSAGHEHGGPGSARMAFKHPRSFPVVAAISPAIDYHRRMDEGDETLQLMYADKEAARARHGHVARPSAQLAPQHLVLLRSSRRAMARKRRQIAHENGGAWHPSRLRSGNERRRPRIRVLQSHGRKGLGLCGRAT